MNCQYSPIECVATLMVNKRKFSFFYETIESLFRIKLLVKTYQPILIIVFVFGGSSHLIKSLFNSS